MKRLFTLVLALILGAGCAGCTKQAEPETVTEAPATEQSQPAENRPVEEQSQLGVNEPAPPTDESAVSDRLEGTGYATPEEAVLAYVDAMNRGDVSGMVSTFAIETYVDHTDPELWLQYDSTVKSGSLWKSVPASNAFIRSLIAMQRRAYVTGWLKSIYLLVNVTDNIKSVKIETADDREALTEKFRNSPLHDMTGHVEFVRWASPVSLSGGVIGDPRVGGNFLEKLEYTGADDYTELVAELRVNGRLACQPMTCVCYGNRWYNLDFSTQTMYYSEVKASWLQAFWIPLDEEVSAYEQALAVEYPEESARWEALQQSDMAGTRWPLVSLSTPDVAIRDSAAAAENDSGAAAWAEIHFTRMGGAMITFHVSPSLQAQLGMSSSVARISFPWSPDGIQTSYTKVRKEKEYIIRLFQFYYGEQIDALSLDNLTAAMDDTSVTITLANGLQAIFRKPDPVPQQSSVSLLPVTASEAAIEGSGFDTPEEAVQAYLEALNRGDVAGMLSTFALETYAVHADPMFYIEMIKVYSPLYTSYFPCSDDYSRSLLANNRICTITENLFYAWALNTTDIIQGVELTTTEEIRSFLDRFRQSPMNDIIGNVSFSRWLDSTALSRGELAVPKTRASMMTDMILSGADDETVLVAEFSANGRQGILAMRCVRYGNRWYNEWPERRIVNQYLASDAIMRMFLWLPTAEEQAKVTISEAYGANRDQIALRNIIQRNDLCGTCWQLVSLNRPDVTITDAAAESGGCKAVRAEMRLSGIGGGYVTVTGSPALQEALGMDGDTARILFSWEPATDGTGTLILEKGIVYHILPDNREIRLNTDVISAVRDGDIIRITLRDGLKAVFQRAESEIEKKTE